jgi:hypothetical protein
VSLDRVDVTASRPSTMPIEIPTTVESITGKEIERSINATDAEDALKYFPSLSVRKRYIGDYDHAVLATRASGTGNSARSLVYADGILLSNLLGNGAAFTPRWGLVTPEEIERIDVLYGPFSAAYSGNSAGAIVDFVTRMPTRLEAHAKLQGFVQPSYRLYGTDDRFGGGEASASIGSRAGAFSWWLALNHLTSDAQPVSFVVKNVPATTSAAGIPVTGAFLDRSPKEMPGYVLGTTTQTHTLQDHAKLKLAYDITPTFRASYTLGWWQNDADRGVDSFLRDAAGATVTSGPTPVALNIDGRAYTVLPSDFARTTTSMEHFIHGLAVKSNTRGEWDVEASASLYDFARDIVRAQVPNATMPDAGRITDQARHRLEHARDQGHLAARRAGRSARRRVRRPARRVQAADAGLGHAGLERRRRARALLRVHRPHFAREPSGPGRVALRARLADDARRALRALARRRRNALERDDDGRLRAAQRMARLAQGRAVVAGERCLGAARIARSRGAHADGERAVPGLDLGDRPGQQRPEPEAGEVVDDGAHGRARARLRQRSCNAVRRAHRRCALSAGRHHRGRDGGDDPER